MKQAKQPNSPGKSPQAATGDTTAKQQQQERDQQQTQKQQQPRPKQQPLYCPTDETDLSIGDQQQVSLLDPREPTDERQQTLSIKGTTFSFASNMIGSKKADNGDQPLQQQQAKKQQAGQKKKNILGAGDEDLESSSDSRTSGRSAKFWLLLILMGLLVALFLVVITLYCTDVILKPNKSEECPDINQPFQESSYRLFATKTIYTAALNYLSLVPLNAANSLTISPPNSPAPAAASLVSISPDGQTGEAASPPQAKPYAVHYDKSSVYRPYFFSSNETLDDVNRRLSGPDMKCEARQFHFYGRHAARYPSRREIERMSNAYQAIKKRIDLIISPSTAPDGQPENTNASKPACFDPLLQFSNWQMFAKLSQGNLVTSSGAAETQNIALRYKTLFPNLFDAKQTTISLGVTNKIRTAQTAANFMQQFTNYEPEVCALNQFPLASSAANEADNIQNNRCYRSFIEKHKKRELSFHKGRCVASIDESVNFKLDRPSLAHWITQSVSERLKLRNPELTFDEMKALYDLCKYETAITGISSIWCSLFTEHQMKFMEYMDDLKTYKKVAYGDGRQTTLTCLLINQLSNHYLDVRKAQKIPDLEAQFYFTHSQVIQKLIAASFYDRRRGYDDYESKLKLRDVPRDRDWQTSLLSPFSANMAFILYSCPPRNNAAKQQSASKIDGSAEFDVTSRHSRIVVALNEQPVIMSVSHTAERVDQSLDDFLTLARLLESKSCDYKQLCPPGTQNEPLQGVDEGGDEDDEEGNTSE